MKIGLGITTYNRPEFAEKCAKAIATKLPGVVDAVYLYNDCSDSKHNGAYERAYRPLLKMNAKIIVADVNGGVAKAKNVLLSTMLEDGIDWLFLIEDDIIVTSPRAITDYVKVAQQTGIHHLSFAHHGQGNVAGPDDVDGKVAYYRNSVGAFTLFSKECLVGAGLLDESLFNAWEHVEHELRLIDLGFMPGAGALRYPDVVGSQEWLKEIPNSIERSSIRARPDWNANIIKGLHYWRDNRPVTYNMLFGQGQPLEQYAQSLLR